MKAGAQDYIPKSSVTVGNIKRIICTAIEHVKLQKRISEQKASLQIFSHALTHDLKEPMRTIRAFADIIMEKKILDEDTEKYFQHIYDATGRMSQLIDTVSMLTQLDSGEKLPMQTLNMKTLLEETLQNLNKLIEEKNVTLIISDMPEIKGNRVQISQVLQNLIANAIRHTQKNVTIDVSAEENTGCWQFSVRDNGEGVDAEDCEKIFLPFKRLSSQSGEGMGLGLAICRKILKLHSGKIWCEVPESGNGALFKFIIPKQGVDLLKTKSKSSVTKVIPMHNSNPHLANVLMIDDMRSDVELTKIILFAKANIECNLDIARNGKEGLEKLHESIKSGKKIDLVLLDIHMPALDGFELLEQIRSDPHLCDTEVIMCTGSIYDEDRNRAKSLGAIDYLQKPISLTSMENALKYSDKVILDKVDKGYCLQRVANDNTTLH